MSLIDFPNVPPLPGIPDLRRSTFGVLAQTGLLGKLQGLDIFGLLDAFLNPTWQLVSYETGKLIIEPDSVIGFEFRADARVAGYPMEQGAFASYNKVVLPNECRMRVTCGGNGKMDRGKFLVTLERLKDSVEKFQIVTPDRTYPVVTLAAFDYKRTATNGITLLTVDLLMQEVRETAGVVFGPVKEPAAADPASMSCLKPLDPTTAQASDYDGHAIA
ncbi:hypothetical protein PF66_06194 [Pseudomonas asplenii]|uniref:Dit-like phage tail protein N-terminal domain-containing protein n=1 Tax=Pseudomonas asplenii TaxID=53407 RepID=A0A0N0E150_9PSED|nr:hypothetical protein [Pseudomonas fuscovaginae]KPA87284.1 hypothetical protein PF66_06194 [Pseudomonas fuscovaginae]